MDSVRWSFGDGHTDTILNPIHIYTANGTYHSCVTVYTYCGSDSACRDIVISGLGIGVVSKNNIQIWPNPVKDELTVEGASGDKLTMTDIVGNEVYSTFITGDKEILHVTFLPRGVYVLQVVAPATGVSVVRRVVKE